MCTKDPVRVLELDNEPPPASIAPIIRSTLLVSKKPFIVLLTSRELTWFAENEKRRNVQLSLQDVIAVRTTTDGNWRQSRADSSEFSVFSFLRKSRGKWTLKQFAFECQSNHLCAEWIQNLQRVLAGMRQRPRILKVFINPFGGKKRAVQIYEKDVRPLWELAGILLDETVTQSGDHAPDIIREMDLRKYDGLICVGGDGLFSQVMNSLLTRTQLEAGVDQSRPRFIPARPRIKLGIIPAGSTNAISYSTTGTVDPVTCALRIAVGDSRGVDVFSAEHRNKVLCFGMSASYGFLGDVLVESEKHRWMGPRRYDYAGMRRFFGLKSYGCEVMYVKSSDTVGSPKDAVKCRTGCTVCDEETDGPSPAEAPPKGAMAQAGDNEVMTEPSDWQSLSGEFCGVIGVTISASCSRSPHGVSPSAHLGDGCIDISLVKKCSRLDFLKLLFKISRTGNHLNLPFVETHRVQEFKLRPLEKNETDAAEGKNLVQRRNTNSSTWNVDGEIMEEAEVQIRVHRQLITLFSRGIEEK